MDINDEVKDMSQYIQFYQIKEMLFDMDGLSCTDKKMVRIIKAHGGLDKFFEEIKARYAIFMKNN